MTYDSEIKRHLSDHFWKEGQHNILEIGSFEGLSSAWFSNDVLSHKDSTLDCVDPFNLDDKNTPVTSETEIKFRNNIRASKNVDKCVLHKMYSTQFFTQNTKTYDLIYIDGSHELPDIKHDMEQSFKILREGGIMWMDDYLGGAEGLLAMKRCMDDTLVQFKDQYDVIHVNYQLAVRKRFKCAE